MVKSSKTDIVSLKTDAACVAVHVAGRHFVAKRGIQAACI